VERKELIQQIQRERGIENTSLVGKERANFRTLVGKLWGALDTELQTTIWDTLSDGETIQLVESLPVLSDQEVEAMSCKAGKIISGIRRGKEEWIIKLDEIVFPMLSEDEGFNVEKS